MHAFKTTLIGIAMAAFAFSASAEKCKGKAGMTGAPGPTSYFNVYDSKNKKIGDMGDKSLSCVGTGTNIVKAGLKHEVTMHTSCDGPTLSSCKLDYGDYHSDSHDASKGYNTESCEIEFDCEKA